MRDSRQRVFCMVRPEDTEVVRNAYYNALREIDSQLGRLIQALQDSNLLEKTILVVLGENGEAFHENNQVCHANKPYNATTHIAAVMYGPKWLTAGEEDYPLEHIDVLPTLFRSIGLEAHPNFQGIDALATDRPELKNRFLYFHTISPFSVTDAVQWAGRWKYQYDRQLRHAELYDLAVDAGETNNVISQHPQLASALHTQLDRWRSRQLAWYYYPQLYKISIRPEDRSQTLTQAAPWNAILFRLRLKNLFKTKAKLIDLAHEIFDYTDLKRHGLHQTT